MMKLIKNNGGIYNVINQMTTNIVDVLVVIF